MFEFFSNESLRKLVVGFGNLFNDVYVGKFDDSGELVEKNTNYIQPKRKIHQKNSRTKHHN